VPVGLWWACRACETWLWTLCSNERPQDPTLNHFHPFHNLASYSFNFSGGGGGGISHIFCCQSWQTFYHVLTPCVVYIYILPSASC
jgi:hypothetical protein